MRFGRAAARLFVGVVVTAATLLGATASASPPGTVTEFSAGITVDSAPLNIAAGSDGNLWFTEFYGSRIGKITPAGTVTEYATPTPSSNPDGIAAGPDGNLWFTEPFADQIGKITPAGAVTEYSLPCCQRPLGITAGPDGNVWFAELASQQIGRINPATGIVTQFSAGITGGPIGITAGPDGNLWFTESSANQVASITPAGVVTEYPVPTAGSGPDAIVTGPDGNLWFTETNVDQIGRINPTTHAITEFSVGITASSQPGTIAAGCDGNLWFTEFAGRVARIRPTGAVTEFSAGITGGRPNGITNGPDGNLWFTEAGNFPTTPTGPGKVANVNPGPCLRPRTSPRLTGLTVTPASVVFADTASGTTNPSYALVTITNNGPGAQTLTTASATPDPPFFPTFGGTCNVQYAYTIPAGASCTFQFGFNPPAAGSYSGTGSISFSSGVVLNVALAGTGT
jgi:streptogramin lyase